MEPFYIIQNFTQLSLCMRVMIMTSFFIFLTFKPAIPNFLETYLEYKTDNIITNLFTHAEVKELFMHRVFIEPLFCRKQLPVATENVEEQWENQNSKCVGLEDRQWADTQYEALKTVGGCRFRR